MHICRTRLCPKMSHQLSLYGSPIASTTTYKFLGVTIDDSLSWKDHVQNLKISCLKKCELLKHISHKSWGADMRSIILLYLSLIKPKLDYGVEAYGSASKRLLDSLEPVQNNSIRIATGCFRSSPIKSIRVISGLKPLETYRNIKTLNYATRVMTSPFNPIFERFQTEAIQMDNDDPFDPKK